MSDIKALTRRMEQNRTKLAVFNVVRQIGMATASEVAPKVDASKPTALKYLNELAKEGLVIGQGEATSSTVGRPPKLFNINASAAFAVGVDFGAPDLTFVLIDLAKNIIDRKQIPTELDEPPSSTVKQIVEGIREIASANDVSPEEQLLGVTVGVPCGIDRDADLVLSIPRLPHWENVPLGAIIQRDFDFPVYIEIGPHMMVLGEKEFGEVRNVENMLYIHTREGIGMGVFADGRLLTGTSKTSSDIGHTIVSPGGPECICGRRGCLEVFASEPAMLKGTQALMTKKLTAQEFFAAVKAGDATAQRVVDEALVYLAIAVVNAVQILDPQFIVLGGNIAQSGSFVIQRLTEHLKRLGLNCLKRGISLQFSRLGVYAGALGSASSTLERLFKPPSM